ncbi:hypothetical protein KEM48_008321 [Puccinia striiformis f. sp. tritici PST-130]|nr:hypothetical protein KEM48_008321 [Puccinia striiformis f. sp. tritici PST-130]
MAEKLNPVPTEILWRAAIIFAKTVGIEHLESTPQPCPPPAAGPANNPFGYSPHLEEPVKLNEVWFSASWEVFKAGFIKFFGDKVQTDTVKAALDACKQGSLSVEGYNTQFGSFAYLIDLTDSDCLLQYSRGLNLNIQKRVENSGWRALASCETSTSPVSQDQSQLT